MILWLNVIGAIVVVLAAGVRRWSHPDRFGRRDRDWGDWPPDQMAR